MNNKWFWRIGSLVALLVFFVSCKKKYDLDNIKLQNNHESEWKGALFDFKSTMRDYYTTYLDSITIDGGDAEITIDDDGLFHFKYTSEVKLGTAEENFKFSSPLSIDAKFSSIPEDAWPAGVGAGVVVQGGESEEFVDTIFYELDNKDFHEAVLERVKFKEGDIKINITTDYQQKITAKCRVLSFTNPDGTTPEITFTEFDHNSQPQVFPIDMAGVVVDFVSPQGNNYIMVEVTSKFRAVPGTVITKDQRIDAEVVATELEWETVEGKVGQFSLVSKEETLKIDALDESVQDIEKNLVIYDPRFAINFENTAGVPIAAEINSFKVRKRDGSEVSLALNNTSITIPADDVNDINDLSTPTKGTYEINKDNSDIVDVLKGGATHIIYDIGLVGGDITQQKLWLRDTSRLVLKPSVDIPFNFSFTKYEFRDTVKCMLCKADSLNDVEAEAELKLVIENGLPIDVNVQGYFYDTLTGGVIDSLFDNGPIEILRAATTNDGKVIGTTNYTKFITIGTTKYHKIKRTDFEYIATGKTANGGDAPVKLHADDQFNIGVGVKVKVKADLSEQ